METAVHYGGFVRAFLRPHQEPNKRMCGVEGSGIGNVTSYVLVFRFAFFYIINIAGSGGHIQSCVSGNLFKTSQGITIT